MGKALKSYADWRLQESLREYDFYFRKYQRLLMSMFEWTNLPDNISSRFIEDKLFFNGLVIFFKSKKLGFYVVSQATPIGLNDYEEPTGYHAYGINKINETVRASDCVVIWNDLFIEGNAGNVKFFAKRLSNIQKTFDVNLEHIKNPYIISCSEGQKNTVQQMIKQKSDGVPYIFTSDDFDAKINVFNLNVQNFTKELQEVKSNIMAEGLTFFGVDNVDIFKRERLVSGEADQNNEQIWLNKNSMYQSRRKAVDEINDKYGLNIQVNLSKNIIDELDRFKVGEEDVN